MKYNWNWDYNKLKDGDKRKELYCYCAGFGKCMSKASIELILPKERILFCEKCFPKYLGLVITQ